MVAVGTVDLASKLPWSNRYVQHSSRRISTLEIMGATGAPVFERMFDPDQEGGIQETKSNTPGVPSFAAVSPSAAPTSRGTVAAMAALSHGSTTGTDTPAANGPRTGAGAGAVVGVGAGGALGVSWGASTPGPETGGANPLYGQGATAVVTQAPVEDGGEGEGAGGALVGVATAAEAPAPEMDIVEVMGQEDEGAGVFGAILHEPGICGYRFKLVL